MISKGLITEIAIQAVECLQEYEKEKAYDIGENAEYCLDELRGLLENYNDMEGICWECHYVMDKLPEKGNVSKMVPKIKETVDSAGVKYNLHYTECLKCKSTTAYRTSFTQVLGETSYYGESNTTEYTTQKPEIDTYDDVLVDLLSKCEE